LSSRVLSTVHVVRRRQAAADVTYRATRSTVVTRSIHPAMALPVGCCP
jgi:hypothetical protein